VMQLSTSAASSTSTTGSSIRNRRERE
jgi:hypothetical protein